MELTYPNNIDEWYVKGTIQDQFGEEIYTEIPGVFNEDGTCNIEQTQEKVAAAISMINNMAVLRREYQAKSTIKAIYNAS